MSAELKRHPLYNNVTNRLGWPSSQQQAPKIHRGTNIKWPEIFTVVDLPQSATTGTGFTSPAGSLGGCSSELREVSRGTKRQHQFSPLINSRHQISREITREYIILPSPSLNNTGTCPQRCRCGHSRSNTLDGVTVGQRTGATIINKFP